MNIITKALAKLYDKKKNVDYNNILPTFDFGMEITKKINQIYITPNDKESKLPESLNLNVSYLKNNNPDWKYKIYQNKDIEHFIKVNYGKKIWSYYERIDPQYCAAKADLFRYLLLYKEGGVYLDLKIKITKSLNDVLKTSDRYILSHWDNLPGDKHEGHGTNFPEFAHIPRGEYLMGFIISSPGHPFLRSVILRVLENIDNYNPYVTGIGWQGTMSVTGPIPYTLTIHKEQSKKENIGLFRWVEVAKDFGFEYTTIGFSQILKTDYRKGWKPLIRHKNWLIQMINVIYLKAIRKHRLNKYGE